MRIDQLNIAPDVLEKIERKHGVGLEEVEEACLYNEGDHVVRRAREGLVALFCRTFSGRYLLVILARGDGASYRVVTARDQTGTERRAYQAQKG